MENVQEYDRYKSSVIYRIYPKSFFDSDGDGIGDIKGITSKLPYFNALGVDVIALSSIFETDSDDILFGITDHRRINPALGTLQDMEELVEEAHKVGLLVYLSFPLSFTSSAHNWFESARTASPLNPYREYYVWKVGKGKSAPNGEHSQYKTPLWSYDEKSHEWYRCVYGPDYPELNFENPRVRKEILNVFSFWRGKGIDGFIVENAFFATKKLLLSDRTRLYKADEEFFSEGRGVYRMLREIRERSEDPFPIVIDAENVSPGLYPYLLAKEKPVADSVFVGECINANRIVEKKSFSIKDFVKSFLFSESSECAPLTTLAFNGKDYTRLLSKIVEGADEKPLAAAKMLAALLLSGASTPAIYQGEEIGMTDFTSKSNDLGAFSVDPELLHARSPFQWDNNPNAAFTDSVFAAYPINDNYHKINLLSESTDENSVFTFYRRMIAYRKSSSALTFGSFCDFSQRNIIMFVRESETERILLIANTTGKPLNTKLPKPLIGESALCELCNYSIVSKTLNDTLGLRPYEVRIFRLRAPILALN